MEKIVCVAGPTASGKTKLAVELAKAYDGEVLSCDSMQIYRGMAIGTAAPTPEEMQGVPHHMIGVADPGEDFSVGKYVELAEPVLQDILSRGKTCVVCGGTGLYADSLLLGRSFAPCPSTGMRETLEAEARQSGIEPLLARLKVLTPKRARGFTRRINGGLSGRWRSIWKPAKQFLNTTGKQSFCRRSTGRCGLA